MPEPARDSARSMGVRGKLNVNGGPEPLTAVVRVERGPRVVLDLEGGATWTLDLDPACAAYVAGRLTMAAGVTVDG